MIAVFAGLLIAGAAAAEEPLRAARWLAPGKGRVAALSTRPAECLPKAARGVGRGRDPAHGADRRPALVGGPGVGGERRAGEED